VRQQVALIGAEGVTLDFEDDAIREIARMAAQLNKTVENIGARRLHTVMERIMENVSFEAAELDAGSVRLAKLSRSSSDLLIFSTHFFTLFSIVFTARHSD
jgi:ATP-dependent protease HslVU (ClpYQ) ATPase subunit